MNDEINSGSLPANSVKVTQRAQNAAQQNIALTTERVAL